MRYRIFLCGVILASLFFVHHAKALVDGQPGQSSWTIASNIAQAVDDVTPAAPTLLFNSDAVSNLITINTSGNYRVAEALSVSINITADDVCLDLNDYEVVGHVVYSYAVRVSGGASRVSIHNGIVSKSGGEGIEVLANSACVYIENVRVTGCAQGVLFNGTDSSNKVKDCVVRSCSFISSATGIFMEYADRNLVSQCQVMDAATGYGLEKDCRHNMFVDSSAVDISGTNAWGFLFSNGLGLSGSNLGNVILRCVVEQVVGVTAAYGIQVDGIIAGPGFKPDNEYDATVIGCIVNGVSAGSVNKGLFVERSSHGFFAQNTVSNCGDGIEFIGSGLSGEPRHLFIKNVAYSNSIANYGVLIENKQSYDPAVGQITTVYHNIAIPS